jgi:hypothetical protein
MSFVDWSLFYFRQWLITHPSVFPVFVYWKFSWRSASCPSPLLQCAYSTPSPSAVFSFAVPCFLFQFFGFFFFFFCRVGGQSAQWAILVYSRGGCGNTAWHLFAHLLVCVSQAGLELASGGVGAFLFSECNVCGEALCGLGVQGVRVLILLGVFFLPSVAPVSL